MKKIATLLLCLFAGLHSFAQIVSIPDANFKAALVGNTAINTNGDTEIQVSEATAYTGAINVNSLSISDITGIASFVNITSLDCSQNILTSLNVSANTALTYLNCSHNLLTSFYVSANTALTTLGCNFNQLTSLSVSANAALTTLNCGANSLTSLNLSANTALTELFCNSNQLTSLNVSSNTALIVLVCADDQLTSLNVSANTALSYFDCSTNPNLLCIQVSDVAAANANTNWFKDAIASYSINCLTAVSDISATAFSIYPNPANNILNITGLHAGDEYRLYNIYGQLLLSEKCNHASNNALDVHTLANDVYVIQFTRNNTKYVSRFVKKSLQ